uniref:Uncharacterized protein n=1 Tax=Moschus moschiferus TaxID=68415 RepID=A0A8C6G264_MOSMO
MGIKVQRPRCFYDIAINNQPAGRVVFELFSDVCPKTFVSFIELSKILWFKVVTSVKEMEVNPFMEDFLKMRVLLLNTIKNFSCQWPTEGRIQMAHNSS